MKRESATEIDARALLDQSIQRVTATDETLARWARSYAQQHAARLAYDLDLVRSTVATDSCVIEIGSSPPFLTLALHGCGYSVDGVDVAPERFTLPSGDDAPEIHKVDIEHEALPFSDDSFDVALFNEVFEHLRINPIFTLTEVCRVLKPGGVLMLSTPNHRSLNGLRRLILHGHGCHAAGTVYEEYDKLRAYGHMGHVREYTAAEVCDFLGRVGFSVRRVIYRQHAARTGARGNIFGWAERFIVMMVPSLRRIFTVIAEK